MKSSDSVANPSDTFMTYSMLSRYVTQELWKSGLFDMRLVALLAAAAIGITAAQPADAGARPREREQDKAWRATQDGHFIPLRVVESRIVPRMRGADYLGPELNGDRYRLKFMYEGRVMWVDVDARTGRVLGKMGF